ncbi:coenzyme F420-reducing hydrogenase beta subunit [Faecalicoccus acidiformans]|uniref:Coenzyme F420-reducing hydrogenase beta subunit n=1 Tax=Faecalicoccus acidiformans TaxID=915173 RepID=A0A7W8D260_9FIRM|nr:Coenzyme F420 hydrogenase/dehydrogenase, beta subunit C-terminal domain [Faecalicoccus acidiformans]MBB5185716.1 coenzyme F420-reducing hydrogenase beta subunit [Faecalicoccus acidiformans]
METVCNKGECTACKACIEKCPVSCISVKDRLSLFEAVIDKNKCIECNLCHNVCPSINHNGLLAPKVWKQGWSQDDTIRSKASSGGIATSIALDFLEDGGIVYACIFKNSKFCFDRLRTEEDILSMQGSKYVKSDPEKIYSRVLSHLNENEKVLFIGLPCQVQAVKNFVGQKNLESLYTIDLICHGSPSPKMLEKFLLECDINFETVNNISFRNKMTFGLSIENREVEPILLLDSYMMTFLSGISYTENCFKCKFAQIARPGDITIGDSWGSELCIDEQKKGISLILCQTTKGIELIKKSRICIMDVDLEKAILSNHQLQHPTIKPKRYDIFWDGVEKGRSFKQLIFRCYPKTAIKNLLKRIKIRVL